MQKELCIFDKTRNMQHTPLDGAQQELTADDKVQPSDTWQSGVDSVAVTTMDSRLHVPSYPYGQQQSEPACTSVA